MIAALFVSRGGRGLGRSSGCAALLGAVAGGGASALCSVGRYWYGGPNWKGHPKQIGDDGGCFEAALRAVRQFGGVLEHPRSSAAWQWFGMNHPPPGGGWIVADFLGGWTCEVEQGHYGHAVRKPTWLYLWGASPEPLQWGPSGRGRTGQVQRLSAGKRARTPVPFRDLLLGLAEGCVP